MELRPLCRMTLRLKPPVAIGAGPAGTRMIFEGSEGTVEGGRLSGTVIGPGADWLTVDASGMGTVDVRLVIRTDDGVDVFVQYLGRVDTGAGLPLTLFIAPRFECGHDRYRWLNGVQAVGKGTSDGQTVVYDIAEVA